METGALHSRAPVAFLSPRESPGWLMHLVPGNQFAFGDRPFADEGRHCLVDDAWRLRVFLFNFVRNSVFFYLTR